MIAMYTTAVDGRSIEANARCFWTLPHRTTLCLHDTVHPTYQKSHLRCVSVSLSHVPSRERETIGIVLGRKGRAETYDLEDEPIESRHTYTPQFLCSLVLAPFVILFIWVSEFDLGWEVIQKIISGTCYHLDEWVVMYRLDGPSWTNERARALLDRTPGQGFGNRA